ncbi:Uncharacterised protein [Legionella spiritensis]|nr:Uncharacterised protein [Legionella spiritensis]
MDPELGIYERDGSQGLCRRTEKKHNHIVRVTLQCFEALLAYFLYIP